MSKKHTQSKNETVLEHATSKRKHPTGFNLNTFQRENIHEKTNRKQRTMAKIVLCLAFIFAGICFLRNRPLPTSGVQGVSKASLDQKNFRLPPCPFRTLTGIYCPGCGSTRSLTCLIHGKFLQSLRYNPLVVIFLPILIGGAAVYFYEQYTGRLVNRRFRFELSLAVLLLTVTLMVLRNIPLRCFDILRPPG